MSDKSVAERLQLKGKRRLAILGATREVDQIVGAAERRAQVADANVVLLAVLDLTGLKRELPTAIAAAPSQAIIWVAYPKLSSQLASDLSRDVIRACVPEFSYDTVSQISIDGDWSALRLKRV